LKKYLAPLVALVVMSLSAPARADRPYQYCDPIKSRFCRGLAALYEFEEDSEQARTSETGTALFLEPDGVSISRSSTHKLGSYSFSHTNSNSSYLTIPNTVGFSGTFTVNFWIYFNTSGLPSADGRIVQVISIKTAGSTMGRPYVVMKNTSGNTKMRFCMLDLQETEVCVDDTTNLSTQTWYMATVGAYADPVYTNLNRQRLWIAVNNNTRTTDVLVAPQRPAMGDLILGTWYTTSPYEGGSYLIDQLGAWSWIWAPSDVQSMYNSGSGRSYPFPVTE
jgi:hypothetical protein